jgi:hypothetical protein
MTRARIRLLQAAACARGSVTLRLLAPMCASFVERTRLSRTVRSATRRGVAQYEFTLRNPSGNAKRRIVVLQYRDRGCARGPRVCARHYPSAPLSFKEDSMQTDSGIGKDPVLLGVKLPVGVTLSAATQVKSAWLQAIGEIVAAARAKANEKKASVSKKVSTAAAKAEQTEVTA